MLHFMFKSLMLNHILKIKDTFKAIGTVNFKLYILKIHVSS